jgi:hypothetical protein
MGCIIAGRAGVPVLLGVATPSDADKSNGGSYNRQQGKITFVVMASSRRVLKNVEEQSGNVT